MVSNAQRSNVRTFQLSNSLDLLCLLVIALGFLALLLIIPPQHEYPIIDDWIYAKSVQHQMATGAFQMPGQSQANLVGLTLWGTLWANLFGFSFTTLTYSTLVFALAGLYAFYGIARQVDVPPWGALLGTALLALNPIFFHLSYSFMTDVPWLSLTLLASYCYIRGLKASTEYRVPSTESPTQSKTQHSAPSTQHWLWLLAGGFFAGYAFLIRQFGLLIPFGFLAYLIWDSLVTRQRRWPQMLGVAVVPALVIGGWYIWSRGMPASGAAIYAAGRASRFLWNEAWPGEFANRALTILPLVALMAWTAVKLHRAHLFFVIFWGVVMSWAMFSVSLPKETYSFVGIGNIIKNDGIDFFEYKQAPIWMPEAWKALAVLGAVLAVLLLAQASGAFVDWLIEQWRTASRAWRKAPNSQLATHNSQLAGFYLVGLAIFVVSLAFLGDFYDRYALGIVPFVIIFLIRASAKWGRLAWTYSVVAVVLLGTFTLLLKADFVDHNIARWQAGAWLQARTPLIVQVGFDWNGWYGFSSQQNEVADIPIDGYRVEKQFPYFSRLGGFTTRYVIAQSRADLQPLREPTPSP